MTGRDLINSALRLIKVIASGENPTADEAQDALMVLNNMIDAWAAEHLMLFTVTISEFPLVVGQQDYTFGPAGAFNAPRPSSIDRASIVILNNPAQPLEVPIEILTDAEWQAIPVKNIPTTVPLKVYDDGGFPFRNISVWGIPTAPVNIRFYFSTALVEFIGLDNDVSFPPGYLEALRYNLAVRLGEEFDEPASPGIIALAAEAKARIKSANIIPVDLKCDASLTSGGAYDWRSDSIVGGN